MKPDRSSTRPLRADAVRNQARILEAAREVFSASGLDVALDDVARHAGVGIATLYRRFPDRESLIVAVFELGIDTWIQLARAALAEADAWIGFTTLLMSMFRMISEDRGMRQHFLSSQYDLSTVAAARGELVALLDKVITRAQEEGELRANITAHDIPPLMLMVGAVADFSVTTNPKLWERYGALLVDGLSVRPKRSPLISHPLSKEEVALAMSQ